MVTGYNQEDWPRLMAGDYDRPPERADYLHMEDTLIAGELVEPLGYDSIWATEHYGSAYSMQPNPLQYLAYWAGRTSRVDARCHGAAPRLPSRRAERALMRGRSPQSSPNSSSLASPETPWQGPVPLRGSPGARDISGF